MDAHRVVERHDSERAVSVVEPVVSHLRQAARALRAMRARDALGAPGGAGGVELDGRLAHVEVERAGVLLVPQELMHVGRSAYDDLRAAVDDAVVEIGIGDAMRKRHEDGPEPLARPVQLDRLGVVREDARDAGLPAATPRSSRPAAIRAARPRSSAYVKRAVSPTSASASGVRSAA